MVEGEATGPFALVEAGLRTTIAIQKSSPEKAVARRVPDDVAIRDGHNLSIFEKDRFYV